MVERPRAAGRARHRGAGRRAGAAAGDAADLRRVRRRTRRSTGRRRAEVRRRAGDADRRRRRDRAGAAEGLSAADASRSSTTTRRAPTFRSIDGNQPPDVVTAADRRRDRRRGGGWEAQRCDRLQVAGGDRADAARPTRWSRTCSPSSPAMVAPGVTTADLDAAAERLVRGGGRRAGVQGLSRLSGDALRVGERAGGARHSVEPGAGRGRHHLARHGREARRVLRRLGGDGAGRAACPTMCSGCCG